MAANLVKESPLCVPELMKMRLGEIIVSDLSDYQDLLEVLNCGPMEGNDCVPKSKNIRAKFNLDSSDCNRHDSKDEIDPDANIYNEIFINSQCVAPSVQTEKFENYGEMAGIMHVNARSILSKMQDFQLLIRKIPVNFVALSEPWLNKDTEAQLQLLGYNVVYNFREDRIGGGVAIMNKEGIKF